MEKQLFLLDIDGTICRGSALIPGARAFLQRIRQAGGSISLSPTTRPAAPRITSPFSGGWALRPGRKTT